MGWACESATAQPSNPASSARDFATWIDDLDAPDPATRAAAEAELLRAGHAALESLESVGRRSSLEKRLRAERLARDIRQAALEATLAAFLAGTDDGASLPAWTELASLVGDTPDGRAWYARLWRRHADGLRTLGTGRPEDRDAFYEQHSTAVVSAGLDNRPLEPEAVALLFFSGALVSRGHDNTIRMTSLNYAFRADRGLLATSPTRDPTFQKLAIAWIGQILRVGPDKSVARTAVQIGMTLRLDDAVRPLIQQALAGRSTSGPNLGFFLLMLGRIGQPDDRPLVERFLEETRISTYLIDPRTQAMVGIEVRDVALAVAIHLAGENPRDYGYKELRPWAETLFAEDSLRFASPDDRTAARQRFAKVQAERPAPPTPAKPS